MTTDPKENSEPVTQRVAAAPVRKAAPAKAFALPASLASRYEVLGTLGAGGMGSVVKARNKLLAEQVVAIKRPLANAAADIRAALGKRIIAEAKGLARLSGNANVARVYDLVSVDNELFLVMELIEGVSLDKLVHKQHPFNTAQVGAVGLQSLDALAAAHREGILHRDIKPPNLMLTPRGRAVLLDFGLAEFAGKKDSSEEGLVASLYYVAPELWNGIPADARCDLYALSLTLYELCTGVNPFRKKKVPLQEVMEWSLKFMPPPPHEINRTLDRAVSDIIHRGLAKDPKQRHQSAQEMTARLEAALLDAGLVPDDQRTRPDGTGPECLNLAALLERDEDESTTMTTRPRPMGSWSGGPSWGRRLVTAAISGGLAVGAFAAGRQLTQDKAADAESQYKEQITTLKTSVQARTDELTDARTRLTRSGEDLRAERARTEAERKKLEEAEKGRKEATERFRTIEGQLSELGKSRDDIREELTKQRKAAGMAQENARTQELEAAKLRERLAGHELEVSRLKRVIEDLEKKPTRPAPKPLEAPVDAETARSLQRDWAEHLKEPISFQNSVGMKIVFLPPGSFLMGTPATEEGRDTDEAPHKVTFTKPLHIAAHEVTNSQYRRFKPAHKSGEVATKDGPRTLDADTQPVVQVTHADALAFCKWLGEQPEEKKAGRTYRLPSEAEWEYACRAGSTTRFWWGSAVDVTKINFSDRNSPQDTREESLDDGFATSAPVGSLPPNPWGLFEMHGNVWEWCSDHNAPYPAGDVIDPEPATVTGDVKLTLRGGSWAVKPVLLRSGCRNYTGVKALNGEIGFRVVCVLAAPK